MSIALERRGRAPDCDEGNRQEQCAASKPAGAGCAAVETISRAAMVPQRAVATSPFGPIPKHEFSTKTKWWAGALVGSGGAGDWLCLLRFAERGGLSGQPPRD